MHEKDLAQHFKELFVRYPLYYVVSKSDPGWPDRMIQLPNSRICFAELKIINLTLKNTFRIDLRADQAAWLAKWQLNGGLCFMMCMDAKSGPGGKMFIITQGHWKYWLSVTTTEYHSGAVTSFDSKDRFMEWFEKFVNGSSYPEVFRRTFE